MAVTEHDLSEAMGQLREEFKQRLEELRQEFVVRSAESGSSDSVALTEADVAAIVRELLPESAPAPLPTLSVEEVRALIREQPVYGDEDLRGDLTRLVAFANGLADRLGVSRMGG